MITIQNPYRFGGVKLYDDASVIYTLRRPAMSNLWTNAVAKIRRTSDNQTAFVFIDGSSIDDTISLSSLISTSSNTTPSATTLGTWVGANDAFVEEWIGITPNNTIDNDKTAIQTTTASQPQLISSGAIILKNSKPAIDFLSDTRYLQAVTNTDLDHGNDITILSVSNNNVLASIGAIMSTTISVSERLVMFNDNRTTKRITRVINSGFNADSDYLLQQNTVNQKLLSSVVLGGSKSVTSFFNGAEQVTDTWQFIYFNDTLQIGVNQTSLSGLNGTIQEIPIFPSDKTADLTDLHNDIDAYYSIP